MAEENNLSELEKFNIIVKQTSIDEQNKPPTGKMKFGKDWSGLFLRGKDAIKYVKNPTDISKKYVEQLLVELQNAFETDRTTYIEKIEVKPQQVEEFQKIKTKFVLTDKYKWAYCKRCGWGSNKYEQNEQCETWCPSCGEKCNHFIMYKVQEEKFRDVIEKNGILKAIIYLGKNKML